jgi:hypothetical protein
MNLQKNKTFHQPRHEQSILKAVVYMCLRAGLNIRFHLIEKLYQTKSVNNFVSTLNMHNITNYLYKCNII